MKTTKSLQIPFFLYILLSLVLMPNIVSGFPNNVTSVHAVDYIQIVKELNMTAITEHLKFFSFYSTGGFGSRMTATDGCNMSADYIYNHFSSIGLKDVTRHYYPVVAPFDYGSTLTVQGSNKSFRIYSMGPNDVVPVITPGLSGSVVYLGDGSFEAINGKNIADKVVVLDYNTGMNWVNVLKFGAKAVIFVESDQYLNGPVPLDIPLNLPRFWMPKEDAAKLLGMLQRGEKVQVNIKAKTVWEKRTGQNIYGVIEGENTDRFIIVSAYYDSLSNVPLLSPAANEAIGISVLLDLARFFTNHKPALNLVFVAFSGHHQSLAGARWFVGQLLLEPDLTDPNSLRPNLPVFSETKESIMKKFVCGIHIQIDSVSPKTFVTQHDSFRTEGKSVGIEHTGLSPWSSGKTMVYEKFRNYLSDVISSIATQIPGATNYVKNHVYTQHGILYDIAFDDEFLEGLSVLPISEVGIYTWLGKTSGTPPPGFAFFTGKRPRSRYILGLPKDRYETVDLNNVKPQVEMIYSIMYTLARTEDLKEKHLFAMGEDIGVGQVVGRTVIYNETSDTRDPVPGALVKIDFEFGKAFHDISDAEGNWRLYLPGIFPTNINWGVDAYKVNETDGNIYYALTEGLYKWGPTHISWWSAGNLGYLVMFPCSTILLLDFTYPPKLDIPEGLTFSIEVLEHATSTAAMSYGYVLSSAAATVEGSYEVGGTMAAIFVPEETTSDILIRTIALGRIPLLVLRGVEAPSGTQNIVYNMPLRAAEEFLDIIEQKIFLATQYKLGNLTSDYEELEMLIDGSRDSLSKFDYSSSYAKSLEAWTRALRLYTDLRAMISDAANSVPFFAAILVPFTALFTLLFFKTTGRKLLATLVSLFSVFLIVYSLLHPGFWVASNSLMVVLGMNVILLTIPILIIVYSLFMDFIKRQMRIQKGLHYAEISRGSALMLAIGLGIENMKKRKLRGALVMVTIILIVSSLTLFTSISALSMFRLNLTGVVPTNYGILIRDANWANLDFLLLDYLQQALPEAKVLPRAWVYSSVSGDDESHIYAELIKDKSNYNYYVAVGVFSDEPWLKTVLIGGTPLGFDSASLTCVIPDTMADKIGANVGDTVYTLGNNYTITGVFDNIVMDSILDLDGQMITPLDLRIGQEQHCMGMEVVLFPFWTLYQMNPRIPSVFILPRNEDAVPITAANLFDRFTETYMYYGFEGKGYVYSHATAYVTFGWQMQIVPMILCGLIILNVMLASVHEREREINTYAVVGLSPVHVSGIFLAETIVFALVGSILGYVGAMSTYRIMSTLGIETGISLNYSSTGVTVAVVFSMLMVLGSTLYPSLKSSKLVTPSLERAWRIPTKHIGDSWEIPLPFVVTDEVEAEGAILYMEEFVRLHGGEMEVFQASSVSRESEDNRKIIRFKSKLAPYELNISQETEFMFARSERGWEANLTLERVTGSRNDWERQNRDFIDQIRKQFLIWKGIPPAERQKYLTKAREAAIGK